jgi:hypothetical protein
MPSQLERLRSCGMYGTPASGRRKRSLRTGTISRCAASGTTNPTPEFLIVEQPLAATAWDDTPLHVPANSPPPRPDSLAAAAFAHLRRRYRRRRSQQAVEMDPKSSNAEPLVRLQIAVTIAMPSPDCPSSSSWTDNEQPLEYSIGLYEMPWKKAH